MTGRQSIVVSVTVALLSGVGAMALGAEDSAVLAGTLEVTATRTPELIDNIPASITVVTGEQLRARGANDLRSALALVAGVEATAGGDAGPGGSVPALWGLREADAFLLVVDNVPWGGAFNPATPSVDLTGVARIEVLRGAAPVMFGATSFVGVIHVIHDAAGESQSALELSGASHGGGRVALQTNLPQVGDYRQSLALNIERRGYQEDRSSVTRYHALYRGAVAVADTRLHVDADVTVLPQAPPGNLLLRDGDVLHNELPIDANYNPAGNKIDQHRYHLALGLDGGEAATHWGITLAATRTLDDSLRGFLRGNALAQPPDAGVGDGLQADGFSQTRGITDVYVDAHVMQAFGPRLTLTYGIDHLHGLGSEHAINFGYCIDPAGHEYSCSGAHHPDELVNSSDQREFSGLYSQIDYQPVPAIDLLGGLRLNRTWESAQGLAIDNTGAAPVVSFDGSAAQTNTRASGLLGASWHAWTSGQNALTWYGDYRNSFKPLSIDFGPEAEVDILRPETAESVELGGRLRLLDATLDLDMSVFQMDFHNGLTFAANGAGEFVRANGASTRFKGFELEAKYALAPALQLMGSFASHDARYLSNTLGSGADTSGNRVPMSPRVLAGLGLIYNSKSGNTAAIVANLVGSRALDETNTVEAGGYTTFDVHLSHRFGRFTVHLTGYNLTDRRDPVSLSELQESVTVTGTAGYYRMTGRSIALGVSMPMTGGTGQ
jgi:outer membrane receptor protein involved in Fe transport